MKSSYHTKNSKISKNIGSQRVLQSHLRLNSTLKQQPQTDDNFWEQFRKIIFILFENPDANVYAKLIQGFLFLCIIFSGTIIILDSVYSDSQNQVQAYIYVSQYIENIINIVFLIEFLLRFISCTAFGGTQKEFLLRMQNIVDLIALIPTIIELSLQISSINSLKIIRVLRFIRIVRIFKISRYMSGIDLLIDAISSSVKQFWMIMVAFIITLLFFSVAVYYSEIKDSQESYDQTKIQQIFYPYLKSSLSDAIWMCIVTITTVGYGDKTPQTLIGRLFVSFLAFVGNSVILALPIAILGLDFQKSYANKIEEEKYATQKIEFFNSEENENDEAERQSFKRKNIEFMYQRVQQIEQKNAQIAEMLQKSNTLANNLTRQLQYFVCRLGENYAMPEIVQLREKLKEKSVYSKKKRRGTGDEMQNQINIFEKMLKAKQKLKLKNLVPNKPNKQEKQEPIDIFRKKVHDIQSEQALIKALLLYKKNKQSQYAITPSPIRYQQDKDKLQQQQFLKTGRKRSKSFSNIIQSQKKKIPDVGQLAYEFLQDVFEESHLDSEQNLVASDEHVEQQEIKKSDLTKLTQRITDRQTTPDFNNIQYLYSLNQTINHGIKLSQEKIILERPSQESILSSPRIIEEDYHSFNIETQRGDIKQQIISSIEQNKRVRYKQISQDFDLKILKVRQFESKCNSKNNKQFP